MRSRIKTIAPFILGIIAIESVLAYIYQDNGQFYAGVRNVGKYGILIAFVYSQILVVIMVVTSKKDRLDRRFIWRTQMDAFLFIYAFCALAFPALFMRTKALSALWFNIWILIAWSSACVMQEFWRVRGREEIARGSKSLTSLIKEKLRKIKDLLSDVNPR